jgi:endonuclease-3
VNKEKRGAVFERLRAAMPAPTTELEYETPFQLLIAVILSAQATDVSVNKATDKLFEHASSARMIRDLGERGLKPYIKSIGLGTARRAGARRPKISRSATRGWSQDR